MPQTLLSAVAILAAADLAHEDVEVSEWGGTIRIQQMSAEESSRFTDELTTLGGSRNGMYLMLIYSARDAEGNRLFTNEQIDEIKKKNINVLNRLQLVALNLNKMTPAGRDELKNVSGVAEIAATPTA